MEWLAENLGIPLRTVENIILSIGAIAVVLIGRALLLRVIERDAEGHEAQYRARKIVNYTVTAILTVTIAFVWIDAFDSLPTYLGLVSAGVAIALADVLKNMAGWVFILTRKPFEVGDRVEVSGHTGDVVDIRLFRFSLMEVGGWVDAEQSTGRLLHIPNGLVFTQAVANYTEGFPYLWDELPILVTFESDWKLGEQLVRDILNEQAPDLGGAAGDRIR
jgi:small-conductance mechanosensitive channel